MNRLKKLKKVYLKSSDKGRPFRHWSKLYAGGGITKRKGVVQWLNIVEDILTKEFRERYEKETRKAMEEVVLYGSSIIHLDF